MIFTTGTPDRGFPTGRFGDGIFIRILEYQNELIICTLKIQSTNLSPMLRLPFYPGAINNMRFVCFYRLQYFGMVVVGEGFGSTEQAVAVAFKE